MLSLFLSISWTLKKKFVTLLSEKDSNKRRKIMRTEKTIGTSTVVIEARKQEKKKVNPTWEAFGKFKGAFTIVDPSILD